MTVDRVTLYIMGQFQNGRKMKDINFVDRKLHLYIELLKKNLWVTEYQLWSSGIF